MIDDEDLLMAVLNSAPVIDGTLTDQLDGSEGVELPERLQEVGTDVERLQLRRTRDALQAVIRGEDDAIEDFATILDRVALLPTATSDGLQWHLDVPAEERLAARAVLAWSRVVEALPGRLRPCANTECNLFLIDHSRPGTAKWCSMATCGNRMKARAYARRARHR